jgi:hypothetical protein
VGGIEVSGIQAGGLHCLVQQLLKIIIPLYMSMIYLFEM